MGATARRARRRRRAPARWSPSAAAAGSPGCGCCAACGPTACSPPWTATRSSCAPRGRRSPRPASPPSRARLIFGTPAEVLPRLSPGAYDMVVCAGPPREYAEHLPALLDLVRVGGTLDLPRPAGRRPDRRPHRARPADRRLAGDRPHHPRGRDAAVRRPARSAPACWSPPSAADDRPRPAERRPTWRSYRSDCPHDDRALAPDTPATGPHDARRAAHAPLASASARAGAARARRAAIVQRPRDGRVDLVLRPSRAGACCCRSCGVSQGCQAARPARRRSA